uniref:Major head protein n=1 Tax=Ralstonia phage BOESR1 TaxID=3034917 RepID=A0AA50F2S9_9CAUD|nr:major head protein [Ralstonia phage BOESR1]
MANAIPSRLGQANQAGDAQALFLKVFAGEVLTAYEEANTVLPYVDQRSISAGKSATFPVIGKASASYHTPGTELNGAGIAANEVVITIDDLLLAQTFIANIDEAMNHYDVRGTYSQELGRALAYTQDKQLLALGILAARASARITGEPGGSVITDAAAATDSNALIADIFAAAQKLDEKDVPSDDRVVFLRPAQFYALAQNTKVLNKDWGGAGVYSDGKVLRVAGVDIVKTNHLPNTDLSADTSALAGSVNGVVGKYRGNFSTTVALVMQKSALGVVNLLDLAMESEYQIQRQGTLMVAKFAKGYGIKAPQCAVEIKVS